MRRLGLCSLALVALLGVLSHIPSSASLAVMSVDLGSEWLKIALVKPGVPMEIVLNKESRRKTPVVIALRDGDLEVGDPAMSTGTRHPKSAYFYLQDLLAKSLDTPLVQTFQKRFPYYELLEDPERGTVLFKHDEDTNYTPEELLAILLNKAREIAQDFAEQPIKDIVITVPVFFNQAERKAVMYAAELAGLKVLQLMNANTAVALNYGVFRRADFETTPTNIMFYDMGAGSATATIVTYQVAKTKEKGVSETNPQVNIKGVGLNMETVETVPMSPSRRSKSVRYERNPELEVRGVGYDRTLGGLEMELRLRDHLAELFTKQKKTPNSVYDSPRSMAKLLKEAKRVKKVLSANADHYSQIEGLLDDKDFGASKVTRTQIEEMNADLFERIEGPIKEALKMSEMSMNEIDQVILMGGSSRIPKFQEVLLKVTGKKELGKNINADEAAALGAVYQAAYLGKGFKVKKFVIRDANLFPIQVSFQRTIFGEEGEEDTVKTVKRTLFGLGNPFPQKKVMTFNRHTDDFDFNVGYNDIEEILSGDMLKNFGSLNLTSYSVSGVAHALKKNSEAESKGIKAHFRMDDSGILHLDSVESVFEKTEQVMEEVNDTDGQSTFAKLSSTISNFFSSGTGEDGEPLKTGEEAEEGGDQPKTEEGAPETEKGEAAADGETPPPADGEEEKQKMDEEPKTDEEPPAATEEDDKPAETEEEEEKVQTEEEEVVVDEEKKPEDEQKEEQKEDTQQTEDKPATEDKETTEDKDATEDKPATEDKTVEDDKKDNENKETVDDAKNSNETDPEKTEETPDKKDGEDSVKEGGKKKKKEKKKVAKPKVVTIKENVTVNAETKDVPAASKESKKASKNKLKELKKKEEAKEEKLKALNKLESFIYETQDKLYDETFEECSVEEERETIRTSLSEASDWLYEQPDDAAASVYKDKHKELKKVFKDLQFRVKELKERPEIQKAIKEVLNYTHHFLSAAKNMSGEDQIFTDVEMSTLANVYNETLDWFRTKSTEQENTPCTHYPVMLTTDMKEKYVKLDREVQYLYNKAKSQPKKKKPKKEKDSKKGKKKSSNTTETADEAGNGEEEELKTEKTEEEKENQETVDAPPTNETVTETQEEAPSEDKMSEDKKEEAKEEEPEVLQLGADGLEIPLEEVKTQDDESKNTEKASDSQSENSKKQTDQSDDTVSDHNKESNSHNTGEL